MLWGFLQGTLITIPQNDEASYNNQTTPNKQTISQLLPKTSPPATNIINDNYTLQPANITQPIDTDLK